MHTSFKQRMILAIAFALIIPAFFFGYFDSQTPGVKASALFQSPLPTPPNDNFEAAQTLTLDVFSGTDITYATLQEGEPSPSCAFAPFTQSIWYAYTPTVSQSLTARLETSWGSSVVGIYSGTALNNLSPVQCTYSWDQRSFLAQAGVTYYFQIVDLYNSNSFVNLKLSVTPPPVASFYYYPYDPSIYDLVWFNDSSYDPGNVGFQPGTWDFGDGSASSGYYASHQFATDGDYTVGHTVTTVDGRTGSTSQVVQVRTRDVYITKMTRPKSVTAGESKKLSVVLKNDRYPQTVIVSLYKSVPGGFYQVGYSEQFVDVNRQTTFYFGYTFTNADAKIGKVNFKAIATIVDGRDALPADNEFITLPITVKARTGRSGEQLLAIDDFSQHAADEESNKTADGPIVTHYAEEVEQVNPVQIEQKPLKDTTQALHHIYMPLIEH